MHSWRSALDESFLKSSPCALWAVVDSGLDMRAVRPQQRPLCFSLRCLGQGGRACCALAPMLSPCPQPSLAHLAHHGLSLACTAQV